MLHLKHLQENFVMMKELFVHQDMIDEEFHNPDKYQLWMLVDLKHFKSFSLNKEILFS
jgi:hypothetical protein